MKIALCQINPIVGSIDSNVDKILEFYNKAVINGSDIVVFPELAITGYPPQDLLLNEKFIKYNILALENIAKSVTSAMIVGYVRKDGSNIYNSAALCENGKVTKSYDKILLPTYDVFDEKRYFSAGEDLSVWPLEVKGEKINLGIQICEDLWDDDYDIKVSSCLLYTSPSPRDGLLSRMPSSA